MSGDPTTSSRRPGAHAASPRPTASSAPPASVSVGDALHQLASYGAIVAQMRGALGVPEARSLAAEALDRLEVTVSQPVSFVAGLDPQQVAAWFRLFGDNLALDLTLIGADPDGEPVQASLRSERESGAALRAFVSEAQRVAATQGEAVVAELRLALAKTRALQAARVVAAARPDSCGTPAMLAQTSITVMYQADAWNQALSFGALALWEARGLFAETTQRAMIALCDTSGYLAGLALDIVGVATGEAPSWLPITASAWRRFAERADETRRLREEEASWPEAPPYLTPDHLRVQARASGLEVTAARLRGMRELLAAAYLASVAQGAPSDELTLRFAGPRPATCDVHAQQQAPTSATDDLARLAAWAYRDASPEKLAIARECLARELPPAEEVAFARIEHDAPAALQAAKANLILYLRRNVKRYFTARQAAQDAVAAYSESVRKSVADLTSDIVDNVYKTLAVLAGALVASLIQPTISLVATRLATGLYVIYIAFVLGVVLRARRERFALEGAALQQRLSAMPELTETERVSIRQPATASDAHFQRYFRWSIGVYVALGVLAIIVFILLWTPLTAALAPVAQPTATPMPK